jgi:3-oxoacyl-[acyl-carrier-protein] synthase-3
MSAGMPAKRVARFLGIGAHRPARVVTNDDLSQSLDTNDAWIQQRVGIASRLIAADDETVADMGVIAGGKALAAAGVEPEDIDLVLLASCSLATPIPGRAPEVAARLGAGGGSAGAVDVNGACAGFCYAVSWAADAIKAGSARHVLVVASERLSDYTDWTDRSTAVIFADGAGAAVIGPAEVDEISRPVWGSDGTRSSAIEATKDDPYMRMEGQAVFRWATALGSVARQACEVAEIEPSQLAAFVPHQANLRIIESLARNLGAPQAYISRDIVDTGNTSAASIPQALTRMIERGDVSSGDPVLLLAFGAGLTYAGQVVRMP